jgi:hypothetical protein
MNVRTILKAMNVAKLSMHSTSPSRPSKNLMAALGCHWLASAFCQHNGVLPVLTHVAAACLELGALENPAC